ncbi:MAG: hypothetical protein JOZ62_08295 [Acidobacteriaceae bacterium]|nr:hypothetical protein [Acidobacteriaceae bacterium]
MSYDPGLTQRYTGALNRTINQNGDFNVRRTGATLRDFHLYLFLINASWPAFILIILTAFITINLIFASLYLAIGVEKLKGADGPTSAAPFQNAFFFSTHTLTTVGYGNVYPSGTVANSIAAFEALTGLMGFAIATGLFFGRFSRPSARIGFSDRMLVAPYGEGTSVQFRIVNRRSNNLIDLSARMLLMTVESVEGRMVRRYAPIEVEREQVLFLPLTWTVVHPITASSPLHGKTPADLAALQAEFLILIKAFDETFSQTVNARNSYTHEEIVWGARFSPAFEVGNSGDLWLEVDKVSVFEPLDPVARLA